LRHTARAAFLSVPALFLAGTLLSCKNDLDKVAAVEVPQGAPDRVTRDVEYFITDSGQVRNRLRAGRIAEWAGGAGTTGTDRTEVSEGFELVFFDRLGREGSVLTARRGVMLDRERRTELYDDVVFVNTKGERLETDMLVWLQDSAKVWTDRAVRVQRGNDIIHGQGLEAAEDFSRYTIRRITGEIHVAADNDGP